LDRALYHVQESVIHGAVVEAGVDAVLLARGDEHRGDVALAAHPRASRDRVVVPFIIIIIIYLFDEIVPRTQRL